MCTETTKQSGICVTQTVSFTSYRIASGDYGKVPAPASSLTIVSIDVSLKALYLPVIPVTPTCVTNNPCLNGGTCHDVMPSGN